MKRRDWMAIAVSAVLAVGITYITGGAHGAQPNCRPDRVPSSYAR
jgi:hypothetical protein